MRTIPIFVLSAMLLNGACAAEPDTLPKMIDITWHRGVDLPQGWQDSDGGVIDGMLITVGGFCQGIVRDGPDAWAPVPGKEEKYPRGFLKKSWAKPVDDPAAPWTALPDFPGDARQEHFAIVLDNCLYVWGGFSYSAPFTYADGYRLSHDRETGQWTWDRLPDLPTPLASAGIAAVGNTIYVMGGAPYNPEGKDAGFATNIAFDGAPIGAHLMSLDTENLEQGWRMLPPCPGTPRLVHAMTAVAGKIYVIGGAAGSDNPTGQLCTIVDNWSFDPRTQSWKRLADTPVATGNFPAGKISYRDRYILCVGGHAYNYVLNPDGSTRLVYGKPTKHYPEKGFFSDVFVYDTQSDTFGVATPLPMNNNLPMTVVNGDQLHLIGGETHGSIHDGVPYGHHADLHLIGDLHLLVDE